MFDSPLSASAYEVLGVAPDADDDELRRAYRLRLRQSHPDTGGDASVFVQVQRAWQLVGTSDARAAYDRGHGFVDSAGWAGWHPPARRDTRVRGQAYGTPGGWVRARYVQRVHEWAGVDAAIADPYDPSLVRTLPRELRRMVAAALAEEATAHALAQLGMGFTSWHDVLAGASADASADDKLDHLVLSPTGLYGLMSEDFGGVVGFRQGEIVGPSVGPTAPVTTLLSRMRAVGKPAGVRFSAAVVVLPDDDVAQPVTPLGGIRGVSTFVVRRSVVPSALRGGLPGSRPVGGNEIFDIRTRLQGSVRFV